MLNLKIRQVSLPSHKQRSHCGLSPSSSTGTTLLKAGGAEQNVSSLQALGWEKEEEGAKSHMLRSN